MRIIPIFTIFSFLLCTGCNGEKPQNKNTEEFILEVLEPVTVNKSNGMKLYVHYMPWFEDKTTNNGIWGQHWTMANKNPDVIDTNGKHEIASWYYPVIGPYASSDSDVIEYHLLLMKYAGIDGVLIDWYGTRDLWDYPANKRNTEALVKTLVKVGLEFAVVYEDRTLREGLDSFDKVAQAKADMRYLEMNFFNKDNYIKISGKPLLLIFGPQEIKTPSDWTSVFSVLKTKPTFLTLYAHSAGSVNNSTQTNSEGEYIWPDATPMETKYSRKNDFEVFMGGAYPGFKDYYEEGGGGSSPLAAIPHENGALFGELLEMARTKGVDYLQLITWNDFGEGTMIEPTLEFRYTFLTELQRFAGVSYDVSVLEYILKLYDLRKKYINNTFAQEKITQAFYYLVSLQTEKAVKLIDGLIAGTEN
ncbi:hypothetical protein EZS27_016948 [termite gut metagenome]|uniref:Uncharacterized protein n=1 Tax=termite gut metagenome TaxID=433724 RepID=A0A5J4RKZ6_9ZZZZ